MSSSSGSTGENWKYRVCYDPEAETEGENKIRYHITAEGLHTAKQKMGNLFDDDVIVKIEAYKKPLSKLQVTQMLLYHEFIVIKTQGGWWWSIEKNREEIAVQRSRQKEIVKETYQQEKRETPIQLIKERHLLTQPKLSNLNDWIWETDQTKKTYNLFTKNCQVFAEGLYEAFTMFEDLYALKLKYSI